MIELKATVVRKGRLLISDNWVSSGYWAVRKSYLANAPMFSTVETAIAFSSGRYVRTIQDEHVEAVVPKGPFVEALRTVVTLSLKAGDIAIFQAPDRYIGVKVEFLKAMGLEHAYSVWQEKPDGPVIDNPENGAVVIMPVEIDAYLPLLAPISKPEAVEAA